MVFEGLGIQKPRNVQPREMREVDKLLAERDRVVQSPMELPGFSDVLAAREELTAQVAQLEFTATDLATLVMATANADYDTNTWQKVGLYTGALLTVLTRRNPSFSLQINLCGGYFPRLFYAAQEVGHLTVSHAHGDRMLKCLAWEGHAKSVYASHLTGKKTLYLAAYKGKIEQVIAAHINGDHTLRWAADKGEIRQLIATHISGDYTLDGAACCRGSDIGQLVASHLKGRETLWVAAMDGGTIRQLLTSYVEGRCFPKDWGADVHEHLHGYKAAAWLYHHGFDSLLRQLAELPPETTTEIARQLYSCYLAQAPPKVEPCISQQS